ncbi:hypothetical protein HML84_04825 [Alcanivorax sp. IO_7]|nr:hypothetical protein HML84_04825 [Alcanivorax sp. IO_7]
MKLEDFGRVIEGKIMETIELNEFQEKTLAIPEELDAFLGGGRGGGNPTPWRCWPCATWRCTGIRRESSTFAKPIRAWRTSS